MVRCADGTLYTGYACDPERRTKVHNTGRGAKYTARRLPVSLVYWEAMQITQRRAETRVSGEAADARREGSARSPAVVSYTFTGTELSGNRTLKVAPFPSPGLSALMVPPCISTMWRAIASPRPSPP